MIKKKPITEMSMQELQLVLEVTKARKANFVSIQNYPSALTQRQKELRIMGEIERRIDDACDV